MEQMRLAVRRTGIEALAGVLVTYRGRAVLLCEGLMDEPEDVREVIVNDLLVELDGDEPVRLHAVG